MTELFFATELAGYWQRKADKATTDRRRIPAQRMANFYNNNAAHLIHVYKVAGKPL